MLISCNQFDKMFLVFEMSKIEKYDDLGNGITKINNKICFVKRGLPLEEVEVKVIKEKKNYGEGIINKIIMPSINRVKPICPFYNDCNGCDFLHTTIEEEKEFKKSRCLEFFNKFNNFYETNDYYRNKIVLHFNNNKLGYYKENSHDIVEIDNCLIVNNKINEIIKIIKKYLSNEDNGKVLIRCNYLDEILININGIYKNINKLKNEELFNNILDNNKVIKGNDYFYEEVLDYKFKVHHDAFFQVNREGLEYLFNIINNYIKDKNINNVLDLYSGTSVLGINVSKYVKKVTSIEINKNACLDAKENIKLNNINNLKIINGNVEDYINKFNNIDLIIIDPARSGLDKKTIEYLNKIKSKYIIYISCNIHSLKRDLKLLNNYTIENINIVDMFRRTNNVETIVLMKKI